MILGARQTIDDNFGDIDSDLFGVIEVVYDDKVAFVAAKDDPEYDELREWIYSGNTVQPYRHRFLTADFVAECRGGI